MRKILTIVIASLWYCTAYAQTSPNPPPLVSYGGGGSSGGGGGGSGTVTSITSNSSNFICSPSTITTSGACGATYLINSQGGTSYTIVSTDLGKLVLFGNASAVAVTLPSAATSGFTAGASVDVQNTGAGTVTITPSAGLINGSATLTLAQNTGCTLTSDGTNWQTSACTAQVTSSGFSPVITSPAQGDILYYNGTNWVNLTHGTNGQFLTTGGAAANPSWTTSSTTGCPTSGCTYTGQIIGYAGTASAPAFGVSANTGIYLVNSVVGWTTGGTLRGVLSSTGGMYGNTNSGTTVNNNTVTPPDAYSGNNGTAGNNSRAIYSYHASAATDAAYLYLVRSDSSTIQVKSTLASGDAIGTIDFQGADAQGTVQFETAAQIQVTVAASPSGAVVPGTMKICTMTTGGTCTTAISFDDAQGVQMPGLASSSTGTTGTVCWTTSTGNLNVDTTTTCLLSLRKFKDEHGSITDALPEIMKLKPEWITWKKNTPEYVGDKQMQPAFIAEDVASIDKRLVAYDPKGALHGVRYQEMTAFLAAGMQEQQQEIVALSKRLAQLEHRK